MYGHPSSVSGDSPSSPSKTTPAAVLASQETLEESMQKEFDALYGHLPSPPSQSEMQQYESVPVAYTTVVSKDSMASGPMDDETISLPDIPDSFQTDDDSPSTTSTEVKKEVPKEQCPGCFKEFEHVMRHLGKSKACIRHILRVHTVFLIL